MENWFDSQYFLTKAILLLIPFIGWLIEIFVRVSALIRYHSKTNIIGLVVFFLLGWTWIFCFIDLIVLYKTDKLMILE